MFWKKHLRKCLFVLWLLLIVITFYYIYDYATMGDMTFWQGLRSTAGMIQGYLLSVGWKAGLIYILIYTIRPLIFFPTSILTPLAAVLFGPWWGWIYTYIGENFSASLAFGTAKYFGKGGVTGRFQALAKFDERINHNPIITTLFLRMVPLFPFDFVNYGLGLSKMKYKYYAIGTWLGVIPGLSAYIFLGASLMNLKYLIPTILAFIVLITVANIWKKRFKVNNSD